MNYMWYTEKQLEEFWQYDCKKRAKEDRPWLKMEDYRDLFEIWLDAKVNFEVIHLDIYVPDWVSHWIEQELTDG